ncbi:hypothetical protein MXB_5204, partial [Myxobolus squamalis]
MLSLLHSFLWISKISFHLDHCGALPWFLTKTHFKGQVFMTHATKAIYKLSGSGQTESLYGDKDLENTLDRIKVVHFHQQMEVCGIEFTCYHAGHVLGACMFLIDIAGVKILYTGDFSRQEDRHLMSGEIPPIHPDVLIMESTYGIYIHEKRELREQRFTMYQTYSGAMNQKMQNQGMDEFNDDGPCVIIASPGMLQVISHVLKQNGFSRDLFERWCSDPKNGVIIAGYSVEGTLAK